MIDPGHLHVLFVRNENNNEDVPIAAYGRRLQIRYVSTYLTEELGQEYFDKHLYFNKVKNLQFKDSVMVEIEGKAMVEREPEQEILVDLVKKAKS